MGKRLADEISTSYGSQSDGATGGGMQAPAPRDVVGMNVSVDGGHQTKAQFVDQRQITAVAFEHRIDQHRF